MNNQDTPNSIPEFTVRVTLQTDGSLIVEWPPGQHVGALGVLELAKAHILKDALPEPKIVPGPVGMT